MNMGTVTTILGILCFLSSAAVILGFMVFFGVLLIVAAAFIAYTDFND